MRCLALFLILLAGCSPQPGTPGNGGPKVDPVLLKSEEEQSGESQTAIEELRREAVNGRPKAQRELAGRLLFGQGVPADPAEAIFWAKKAALNGDETASLWTGRAALTTLDGRVEACAWFLVAQDGGNAAVREDASAEMEALAPSQEELAQATTRAAELKKEISANLK